MALSKTKRYIFLAGRITVPILLLYFLFTYTPYEQSCQFYSMGGVLTEVKTYDAKSAHETSCQAIQERFEELESILSNYRAASFVSKVNSGELGQRVELPPEVFELTHQALEIYQKSGGYFDITILPLVELWQNAEKKKRLPRAREVRQTLRKIGSSKLLLNEESRELTLVVPGMKLDYGAIAKGYMADEALAILRKNGVERALVNSGGDITLFDESDDPKPFRIGIKNPDKKGTHGVIEITSGSIVTSGSYNRYYEIGGKKYSHILNPHTGRPASGCKSITVKAPTGALADAWATAFCVIEAAGRNPADYVADGVEIVEYVEE